MARPLRVEFPGAVYHVTSRGNAGRSIYLSDSDRCYFLDILNRVVERYHWLCHAYCLMNNHYHFLFETPEANLAGGMRQLNGVYTGSDPATLWEYYIQLTEIEQAFKELKSEPVPRRIGGE